MRRNRISLFLLIILISVIGISCESKISRRLTITDIGPTPVPVYLKPLTVSWRLFDDSLILQKNSSIAIQAIYLNGQKTILFFTLSGIGFEEFIPGIPIQITDERGYSSKLLKVIPFGIVDKLSAGIMVFEPRHVGAQKLILRWPIADGGTLSNKLIAIFNGEADEDNMGRTYYASHDGSVNQDGYRVSISWGFSHGDQKDVVPAEIAVTKVPVSGAQLTPTPVIHQPLAELASDESIMQECSFVIQDTDKYQIKTINVQLLTDANAIVQFEGNVSVPGAIIINEPVPTSVPSAYP